MTSPDDSSRAGFEAIAPLQTGTWDTGLGGSLTLEISILRHPDGRFGFEHYGGRWQDSTKGPRVPAEFKVVTEEQLLKLAANFGITLPDPLPTVSQPASNNT